MGTRTVERPARPPDPAMDPRIRQRRIGVRRDEGRRRLTSVVAAAAGAVLLVAGFAAARSPLFDVDRVVVGGAAPSGVSAVRAAGAVRTGSAMIDLDPDAVARRVAALPQVDEARVSRRWPATVRIAVTLRIAVAQLQSDDGGRLLVDRSGRVLERLRGARGAGLVLAGHARARPGQFLGPTWRPALAVAAALPAPLRDQVASVVGRAQEVSVKLVDGVVVDLSEASALSAKFTALSALLGQPDRRCFGRINLGVPTAPALTRRAGCA